MGVGDVECKDGDAMSGWEMFSSKELLLLANECSLKAYIVVLRDHLADVGALDFGETPQKGNQLEGRCALLSEKVKPKLQDLGFTVGGGLEELEEFMVITRFLFGGQIDNGAPI